ncbi:MAG TPA: hypothetical protein VNK95_16570, partial [Caldilineaceae bacterium]|nr:hypothetical protein [Caldilineaceae bacterium]
LPADATSIVLSFRYYPLYESTPGPGDLQYVDIYTVDPPRFAGRALGAQLNDRTWRITDYDLTSLAGQQVRLVFAVNNDGVEGRTAMYVDNVSVMACNFRNIVTSTGRFSSEGTALPDATLTPQAPLNEATVTRSSDEDGGRAVALPAVGEPLDQANETSRAWLARLGAVGVLVGVLGAIGFAALVIIGARRDGG